MRKIFDKPFIIIAILAVIVLLFLGVRLIEAVTDLASPLQDLQKR